MSQKSIPKTRLAFLMQLTNVTGKALSSSLHVDMSLVSRWKNGKRSLCNNVEQLEKICEFFISSKKGTYLSIVHQIIEAQRQIKLSPDEKLSCELAKEYLSDWFHQTMPFDEHLVFQRRETSNYGENSELFYRSYIGNEGRRQAIIELFEKMLYFEQPHRLLMMSRENDDWLREDPVFFETWKETMLKILNRGHHLTMIRGMDRQIDELLNEILQGMPLYLTGQVDTYVEPNKGYLECPQSFYLIENAFTLSGFSINNNAADRFTAVTNDLLTIQSHQKLIEKILTKCSPLVQVFDKFNVQMIKEAIIKAGANTDNSYFMASELFFSNMTHDLLSDILDDNGCTLDEKECALSFHHQINQNFGQNVVVFENHHIYNYMSLEKYAKQSCYRNSHLSFVTGRPIQMTRQHFIRHIEGTVNRLEKNKDYNIALTKWDQKSTLLEDLDIWIKDGYFLCAWSHITYERIIISTESSVTHVFTQYYQKLWQSISMIEKDKATVIQALNKLLRLAKHLEVGSEQ